MLFPCIDSDSYSDPDWYKSHIDISHKITSFPMRIRNSEIT